MKRKALFVFGGCKSRCATIGQEEFYAYFIASFFICALCAATEVMLDGLDNEEKATLISYLTTYQAFDSVTLHSRTLNDKKENPNRIHDDLRLRLYDVFSFSFFHYLTPFRRINQVVMYFDDLQTNTLCIETLDQRLGVKVYMPDDFESKFLGVMRDVFWKIRNNKAYWARATLLIILENEKCKSCVFRNQKHRNTDNKIYDLAKLKNIFECDDVPICDFYSLTEILEDEDLAKRYWMSQKKSVQ